MHLPRAFREIPAALEPTVPACKVSEISFAKSARRAFARQDESEPYVNHLVRTFRLAQGRGCYIELGSRDKGNVAYVAQYVLGDRAKIIEVDGEARPDNEKRLQANLKSKQTATSITGHSLDQAVFDQVRAILDGEQADVIFCNSFLTYQATLSEFDLYYDLLALGGFMIFHDCYYENLAGAQKGKAQALAQLDRFHPIYVVFADEPTHRFLPRENNTAVWGGCGVIVKS